MNNLISTQLARALMEYLKKSRADLGLLLEGFDYPLDYLTSPKKTISNEDFIMLLQRAEQVSGNKDIAYWTGRTLMTLFQKDLASYTFLSSEYVYPSMQLILKWLSPFYPLVNFELRAISKNQLEVKVIKRNGYLHTYYHCALIRGILEEVLAFCGVVPKKIEEKACVLLPDQALKSSRAPSKPKEQTFSKVPQNLPKLKSQTHKAPEPGPSFTQTINGTQYGAEACIYFLEWKLSCSWLKKIWDHSLGLLTKFGKMILLLEKSPVIDEKMFQQISTEWKRWLSWEESYRLTKTKYLAYLGVVVLSGLPLAGHFFHNLGNGLRDLFNLMLSGLILSFGLGITKLMIGYARELHQHKQQADQFMQSAGVGLTMINRDYEIVYANPQILELYGEVMGRKCYEVFRWENSPCRSCVMPKVLEKRSRIQAEVKNITRNGEEHWFYITATPIFNLHHQATGILLISTDIQEKKQLEFELSQKQAELSASESKYRNFMENAADAILITDRTGALMEASHRLFQLLEIEDEKGALNTKLLETVALGTEEKQKLALISQAMIQEQSPKEFELKLRCASGKVIDVEVRAIPLLKDREVCWLQYIMRDITARKRLEFEKNLMLSISKAIKDAPNLQELLDQALKGICAIMEVPIAAIFLKSPEQPQLELSAQVGLSSEAIKRLARIAIDGSAQNIASRAAVLNRPIVVNNIHELKINEDTRKKVELLGVSSLICMPMVMEEKLQGVIQIVSRDPRYFDQDKIRILSQMANELAVGIARQRLRDALEETNQRLILKNKELENATLQLLQSEKMASIGQLAAGIAHEINNPMGFINANLNVLEEYRADLERIFDAYERLFKDYQAQGARPSNPQTLEHLNSLRKEVIEQGLFEDFSSLIRESKEGAERVKKIILSLKEFSHPRKGEPELADLNAGIESTLNIVWNELKYKAKVFREYGELPKILCYPQELNQVFMNILVNASQAILDKGEIRIKTWAQNGTVLVRISDTGIGIPPENLPKIFDPFFTTKEVGKGTGLGLSISYGIIKKHHGEIKVESQPGKGSAFTIILPVKNPEFSTSKIAIQSQKGVNHDN